MDELEDFIIGEAYTINPDEAELIESLPKPLKADDWDTTNLQDFKNRFRMYMEQQQNSCCAYCRTYVDTGNSPFDIEHIVPKSKHPEWTFLPENLCLSCRKCNFAKGKEEILVNKNAGEYPHEGSGFKIVHPYFDKYSEHIELVNGILYRGLTDKGRFTIEKCKLDRYELAASRVRHKIQNTGSANFSSILMTCISNPNLVNNFGELIERIKSLIGTYKKNRF